jgi:hypothetical protein
MSILSWPLTSIDKLLEVFKRPITLEEYKKKHRYDYLEGGCEYGN